MSAGRFAPDTEMGRRRVYTSWRCRATSEWPPGNPESAPETSPCWRSDIPRLAAAYPSLHEQQRRARAFIAAVPSATVNVDDQWQRLGRILRHVQIERLCRIGGTFDVVDDRENASTPAGTVVTPGAACDSVALTRTAAVIRAMKT